MKSGKRVAAILFLVALMFGMAVPAGAAVTVGHTAKASRNVYLRKKASKKGKKITKITKGKVVVVLGKSGEWYKVDFQGKKGYSHSSYYEENDRIMKTTAALRMRSTTKTSSKKNIILVIPKGMEVEVIAKYTNGWYKVLYNKKYGYCSGDYLTEKDEDQDEKYTIANLNLRKAKSTSSDIILTIPKGSKVTVVTEFTSGWTKVIYNKKTGYVRSTYLKDSYSGKEATSSTKEMAEAINMRSSMSKASTKNIIDVVPKGKKVTIVAKESGGWYKIKYNGKTGYIMGGHFTDDTSRMAVE